jgi:hypothetical protein
MYIRAYGRMLRPTHVENSHVQKMNTDVNSVRYRPSNLLIRPDITISDLRCVQVITPCLKKSCKCWRSPGFSHPRFLIPRNNAKCSGILQNTSEQLGLTPCNIQELLRPQDFSRNHRRYHRTFSFPSLDLI